MRPLTPEQTRLQDPRLVAIKASSDAIYEMDLDTFEGEQWSHIWDVIRIAVEGDELILTTCRTAERPERPVFRIPVRYIDRVY